MWWIALIIGILLLIAGFIWWRSRRQIRLISFVALTRKFTPLDPAVLASVAGKAWNADLGDGHSEGADGFVACPDEMDGEDVNIGTISHDGQLFLINSFGKPYSDDKEKDLEGIADIRLGSLYAEHEAWFSVDAMGVDNQLPDAEIKKIYRKLAKLFADMLDDNCLLIFLPDEGACFPINEETEAALRSKDPIGSLNETLPAPFVGVEADDPSMAAAVKKAHDNWPKFVEAFEKRKGTNFGVKAPITRDGNTEFIWIEVTTIEGNMIYGKLANEPFNLGKLKLGSKVSTKLEDMNDWGYQNTKGNMEGGFTIDVLTKAARKK